MTSDVPIIINCRDRVSPLRQLVDWLQEAGHERVVLLDNASTYGPLLEFYESTWCEVVRLDENLGAAAPWRSGLVERLAAGRRYVVSDPDVVPDEACPTDAVSRMGEVLDRYPGAVKAGLSLRIDDLPEGYPHRAQVIRWESQFWQRRLEPGLYQAFVDTTFALYREGVGYRIAPGIRLGPPYQARHAPWYSTHPTPEERYYLERSSAGAWGTTLAHAETPPKKFNVFRRLRWWAFQRHHLKRPPRP